MNLTKIVTTNTSSNPDFYTENQKEPITARIIPTSRVFTVNSKTESVTVRFIPKKCDTVLIDDKTS